MTELVAVNRNSTGEHGKTLDEYVTIKIEGKNIILTVAGNQCYENASISLNKNEVLNLCITLLTAVR